MTTEVQRGILVQAVRRLVEAARTERGLMPERSPEREFYLGVEAAAEGVLHPELEMTRTESWVERHTPEFREGYTRTATLLATARSAAETPMQLRLPDPRD
ncbi:MAG TPA: hypothetical protein VFC99_00885 [Acidimicrobiia bacterium]|nr:hypothetical protein [Acidimicrobiia bacterium]